jgi:lipoprotein-anchoring transpeptidase ErfK/SrfK
MIDLFVSPRTLKLVPFFRIFLFFVLSMWLAACAARPVFLAGDVSVQAHPQLWAQAEIAKPTYTPSPTLAPTYTPSPKASPTSTPGIIYAEIVPDTPTPQYAAQQAYTQQQSVLIAPSYGGSKYILISISEQHLYAYQGDALVYSFVASTGMNNATSAGTFSVLDKIPNAYGATWNIWMPNWLGIYWAGSMENGIHALPILPNGAQLWAGFLGRPISYGCIVLGAYEAQLLYDWADIGTPVEIRW